jgi:hypothetical protein
VKDETPQIRAELTQITIRTVILKGLAPKRGRLRPFGL